VSPYNSLGAATITGMKLSKRQNIYLTGSINGVSGGQNFSACYLIRASFASRGLPQVEYTFPVTGDAASSFRGVGLALYEDETQIYFLEDQFDSFTTHSQEAIWLVSVEVPAALRLQNDGINSGSLAVKIETWPNPVTTEINIRSNQLMNHVEISDINGKVFLSEEAAGVTSTKLDVSNLSGGMYFVKIQDINGNSSTTKFTK